MSILERVSYLCSLSALLTASAVSAFAQTDTGTLLGSVVDPTQALVPNAKVTLQHANGRYRERYNR